jgi:hypothetical protein
MQIYPKLDNIESPLLLRFQRILFWGFLYTVLAGVIRKWIFPFGIASNIFLFGQLVLPLVLAWQYSKTKKKIESPYQSVLVIYFLILVMMALNSLNHTVFHGILGIIIHFGFWYLLLAYLKVANQVSIDKLDTLLFIILIGETILATIQYGLPPDHILNRYAVEDAQKALIGDAIRVTGTFSYLGGFGALAIFYGFFSWSLLNRNKKPILIIVSIALALYFSFLSGGRSRVIAVLVLTGLGLYENRNKILHNLQYYIGVIIIILVISIFFNPFQPYYMRAWNNFYDRTEELTESGETSARINSIYMGPFLYHGKQPVFGAGLGSTYQGANAILGTSVTKQEYGYMEGEAERIVFEGGYTLYLIRIGLFILVLSALKIKKLSKIALFILFINNLIIFQTYLCFFIAMGLMWINSKQKIENQYG